MANKSKKVRGPLHPGELLREEFLKPLNMTPYALAKALDLLPQRVNDIVREKRGISVDTARRLAAFFKTSPELWMGLQDDYELELERDRISDEEIQELVVSIQTHS